MTENNTKDVFKDTEEEDVDMFNKNPDQQDGKITDEAAAALENIEVDDDETENDETEGIAPVNRRKYMNSYKVEGNILEHPFFLISSGRGVKRVDKRTIYTSYDEKGNKRILELVGGNKLPGALEMDVTFVLFKLFGEQMPKDGYIECTIYEICKILGYTTGGKSYRMVTDALRCLLETTIYSAGQGTIYVKKDVEKEGEYIKTKAQGLHIIENLESERIEKLMQDGSTTLWKETLKLKFNSYFLTNLVGNYFKYINYDTYFSLNKALTKRLYAYLEKKKGNKTFFSINYDTLARQLPLSKEIPSYVRPLIEGSVKELIEKNFIVDVEYEPTKVTFYFKKKPLVVENARYKIANEYDFFDGDYRKALIERGVSKGVADKILSLNLPNEIIEKNLFYFTHFSKEHNMQNPPGFINTMFMEDFLIPENIELLYKEAKEEYLKAKKAEEDREKNLEAEYERYIDEEIAKFKEREPEVYKLYEDMAYNMYKENKGRILDVDPEQRKLFEEKQYEYPPVITKFRNSAKSYLALFSMKDWLKIVKKA